MRTGQVEAIWRIGVLLWLNQEHGRQVFRGVNRYAERHRNIRAHFCRFPEEPYRESDAAMHMTGSGSWDGLISTLAVSEFTPWRDRILIPTVEAPPLSVPDPTLVSVACCPVAIGQMAVDHFAMLGLTRILVFRARSGTDDAGIVDAVRQAAQAGSLAMQVLNCDETSEESVSDSLRQIASRAPVGVFCLNGRVATLLLRAAQEHGVRCPEDMALLGAGSEPMRCMVTNPMLSSIDLPGERIGYLAAQLIDQCLSGGQPTSCRLQPNGVIERGSTDLMVSVDPYVAAAVSYIRNFFHRPITTRTVAAQVGLSLRALESRFHRAESFSAFEELTRCRVAHAIRLLSHTHRSIKLIAHQCGGMKVQNFCRFFKQHTGQSPGQYRSERQRDTDGMA